METNNKKQETEQKTTIKNVVENKVVNLFEDMNHHDHNQNSYDKMIKKQNDELSKNK